MLAVVVVVLGHQAQLEVLVEQAGAVRVDVLADDDSEPAQRARSISMATSVVSATDEARSLPLAGSKASHAFSKPGKLPAAQPEHSTHLPTLCQGTPMRW